MERVMISIGSEKLHNSKNIRVRVLLSNTLNRVCRQIQSNEICFSIYLHGITQENLEKIESFIKKLNEKERIDAFFSFTEFLKKRDNNYEFDYGFASGKDGKIYWSQSCPAPFLSYN